MTEYISLGALLAALGGIASVIAAAVAAKSAKALTANLDLVTRAKKLEHLQELVAANPDSISKLHVEISAELEKLNAVVSDYESQLRASGWKKSHSSVRTRQNARPWSGHSRKSSSVR